MMRRFEIQVATRHLLAGGWQTVLTILGVVVAVTLVVFIASLIYGSQIRWTKRLTDYVPHVTVRPPEPQPVPLDQIPQDPASRGVVAVEVEQQALQRKYIEGWREVVAYLRRLPDVRHVAPGVTGQAFVHHGARSIGVTVIAADPEVYEPLAAMNEYLVAGRYVGMGADEAVIGWRLSRDLGVGVGQRIRVTSSEGVSQTLSVAGIFDTGQDLYDQGRVYVTLRTGQSLFGTGNDVSTISVKLTDMYRANAIADHLEAIYRVETDSWMRQFSQFLNIFTAQRAITVLITSFSLLASSLGIASVLIVSVLQKSKQIGILKAMGARRSQILAVFTLEGLFIALVGACLGAVSGSLLLAVLAPIKQPPRPSGLRPDPLFPVQFSPLIVAAAMVAAVIATLIASIVPARRAAALDPVEVIRGG